MTKPDKEEIFVLVLHCSQCQKTRAWVSVYEGDSPPAGCRDCSGQLTLVHGKQAVEVCLFEAEQWRQMAGHALNQAKLNLRFQDALTRAAFAEHTK